LFPYSLMFTLFTIIYVPIPFFVFIYFMFPVFIFIYLPFPFSILICFVSCFYIPLFYVSCSHINLCSLLAFRYKYLTISHIMGRIYKAVTFRCHGGPCDSETSRLPEFLDRRLRFLGEVINFTRRPPFTQRKRSSYYPVCRHYAHGE
jgi:hypothetical protein